MVEPILSYMRTLRFTGPEQIKRYYRLFGDLEYDLLALRAESAVMELRLREIKRRMAFCASISEEEEREISVSSHELAEHFYSRLDALQGKITASKNFQFNQSHERQSYYLLYDIAMAIMGIEDESLRSREYETFDTACAAYGRLDISALLDLHDSVQSFLALERREHLERSEEEQWHRKLEELLDSHPLRFAGLLNQPERIREKMGTLKRKIASEQTRLEKLGMIYTAAIRTFRYRN
jgi:hypothetical protein